jgi:RNA polymerase sigma-70 factor (ECF subfamily)
VFIKIWSALPSFRGDSQLYTWLYRIATNETLNRLKKLRREYAFSLESVSHVLATRIDEDPYFSGNALQRELHKAIQKLPEKQRLVFTMRYFDEMKYEDIAEITGTSVGALKASYHHAYNKIKETLENTDF